MKRFQDLPLPMDARVANRRDVRSNGVVYYSFFVRRDGQCVSFFEVIGPVEALDRRAVVYRLRRARALRSCVEPVAA